MESSRPDLSAASLPTDMAIRLRNKITGTEREFSDRTAAAYLANPDNGWTKAAGKRSKKRSDDADPPADQED